MPVDVTDVSDLTWFMKGIETHNRFLGLAVFLLSSLPENITDIDIVLKHFCGLQVPTERSPKYKAADHISSVIAGRR
jgi:hypothetical protein